ncbi:MAG: hypothetical protein KDC24_05280 [Saprospiraceae bacterium]|nr:hypothetical protein [Saprospiraceae bacterium]
MKDKQVKMDARLEKMITPTITEGLKEVDEKVIESLFKNHSAQAMEFVQKKGGTLDDAKHLFLKSLHWIAAHVPHHNNLHQCKLSSLLQDLMEVFWFLDFEEPNNRKPLL